MRILFNPTGTNVRKEQLEIRVDIYPEEGDLSYESQHVLVDGEWRVNPCLCHFIKVDEGTTLKQFKDHIAEIFDKDTLASIDATMTLPDSAHRLGFVNRKPHLAKNKVKSKDHDKLKETVNTRFNSLSVQGKSGGRVDIEPPKSIDIGAGAADYDGYENAGSTLLDKTNPANAAGTIDTWEVWANTNLAAFEVGTAYLVSGSNYSTRDYESIGNVTSGSKQTFTGKSTTVETGDFTIAYWNTGRLEVNGSGGSGIVWVNGSDQIPCTNQAFSSYAADDKMAVYGTGVSIVAPTDTTQACTDVDHDSATGNGNITATGGATVTRRGFCYKAGTSGDPVTTDSVVYDDGSFGTGAYTKAITGLSEGTGYRVRAYAVNSAGTGYGATVQLTTSDIPVTTTQAGSAVEVTTATGNGNITDLGAGGNCDHRGVVWDVATKAAPGDVAPAASGYANNTDESGTFGTGAFTAAMTSLPAGTIIYYRAWAHNSSGYGYGGEVTFLTKPAAPTNVAATDGTDPAKVVLTWTKSTSATNYKPRRDGVVITTLGDVATYDDTGAGVGVITADSIVSRNRYFDGIKLDYDNLDVAPSVHTYDVIAVNATGESSASASDTGYRDPPAIGDVTITSSQWERSAADSDAAYSEILGATVKEYFDSDAPAHPTGRYYRCVFTAAGFAESNSTPARGYRRNPVMPDILPEGRLVIKDMAGTTLAPVANAFGAGTDYSVNRLGQLTFSTPADVLMVDNLIEPNTVWLYDQDGKLKNWFWIARLTKDS